MFNLKKRHSIEEEFHDNWARDTSIDSVVVKEFFEAESAIEGKTIILEFGELKGKKILDLGCGTGMSSVYFALKGAHVFAVDISSEMLRKVDELSRKYGVKLDMFKMTAENLRFDDGYFDFVFASGALHHTDVKLSIPEVSRVLKIGCKAIFLEPLGYNPIINMYRSMTKEIRTESEMPFKYSHLNYMKDYFSEIRHENFWLLSLIVFVYMYIIERVDPVTDRYWERVRRENDKYGKFLKLLHNFDKIILHIFPFLGRFCWNIMVILKK